MPKRVKFLIIFDDWVESHLDHIESKDHNVIFDAIEQQLSFEPMTQTRNRKPMRIPNTVGATWELRCGANNRYRVFYDVDTSSDTADDAAEKVVLVLAVGRKVGNRLFIGKEEFTL